MRIRSALLALTIVPGALAFAVTPADHVPDNCSIADDAGTPDDGADDVLACSSAAYLSCKDAVDPAGKLHDPVSTVSLSAEAPADSFTTGAGCGEVEFGGVSGTAMNNIYDLNIAGFVTGNVDSVTFEFHSIYAAQQRAGGEVELELRFDVGGVAPNGTVDNEASGTGTVTTTPAPISFSVPPLTSDTGISESFTMTVTDMYEVFPELSDVGDGSDAFQQLNATVHVVQTDWVGPWVWGATEIPASITLNKQDELGTTVSATSLAGATS